MKKMLILEGKYLPKVYSLNADKFNEMVESQYDDVSELEIDQDGFYDIGTFGDYVTFEKFENSDDVSKIISEMKERKIITYASEAIESDYYGYIKFKNGAKSTSNIFF